MRIAICDDFEQDAQRIAGLLKHYREANRTEFDITVFESADALMEVWEPGHFQILFLDIYMPGTTGMEAARRIRAADSECALVFTTVSPEYAIEGFEVRASHYLSKPVDYAQMDEAMNRCWEQVSQHAKSIELTINGRPVSLRLRDICFAEVFRKSCILHTINGDMTINLPIDKLEEGLGGLPFLRCHRSYIVNLSYVKDVEEYCFIMNDGSKALIPVRHFAAMKQALHRHRFSQMTGAVETGK